MPNRDSSYGIANLVGYRSVVQEHPWLYFKSSGNARDIIERHIALRALDTTQVRPVDAALVRQRLLAQATFGSQPAHVSRQHIPERPLVSLFHKGIPPSDRF